MEQHERAAVDPLEGQTEQGGEDPAPAAALAGAKEGEQERVSETHNPVSAAASEGAKKQDLEETSPESDEVAGASAGASTSTAAPAAGDPAPHARGRKQPRPEHFIPEEAAATASAKARRGDIILDRFLSSTMARGSSASDWARDITAEDAGQPERPRGVESFRIRDASRHAARACGLRVAISRLGASCGGASSPSTAAPGQPDGSGSGRMYGILAVLGASLALSVVSCVLFYLVGRGSEAAPSGENQDK